MPDGVVVTQNPPTRHYNTDLAPFVLSYLGIPLRRRWLLRRAESGTVLQGVPVNDKLSYLDRLHERTRWFTQRPFLLRVFVISIIILVLAGLAGLPCGQRLTVRVVALLEALMVFPPVLLLLPAWPVFPLLHLP